MKMIKTPGVVKRLYSDYIWKIDTQQKELFLTFDDGPTPEVTEWVLQQLEQYNAKATFFCIGKNVATNSDLFIKIKDKGHATGNHTFSHLKGWKVRNKRYVSNIKKGQKFIDSVLFRPPYGKIKRTQARAIKEDFKIIMWDVLTYDYDVKIDAAAISKKVINAAEPGSIVVFHDSLKAFNNLKIMLPAFLLHFSKLQYTFKAIELPLHDAVN